MCLQRIAEDLEYRHLLDQAQATSNPAERAMLVAAFIASGYSATLVRESKPFNPLLGETFEWQSPDSSCRFLCEQVLGLPRVCWGKSCPLSIATASPDVQSTLSACQV